MSHQPFEPWHLDESPHTPQQEAALQELLSGSAEARRTYAGWQAVHNALLSAPMAQPAEGFGRRFSAVLLERRARQAHRRQVRNLIVFLSFALFITTALLAAAILRFSSPAEIFIHGATAITSGINLWNQVTHVFVAALRQPIFLGMWIVVTSSLSLLACIWLFTLWNISLQGAEQNE